MTDRKPVRAIKCLLWILLVAVLVFSITSPGRSFWREAFRVSGFGGDTGEPLSIHVLDVGKADAILIVCEGHAALLDAGTAVSGNTVVDYMARNGIEALDYAIASHPDSDHIGGMSQVLSEVETGAFVRSPWFPEAYGEVSAGLEKGKIPEEIVSLGDRLPLGGAELQVLGPVRQYEETNNASLVLRLEYNGFSALFCGDVEADAERDLVRSGADLSADLFKVPHHGSTTSCTNSFLTAVSPENAVVSVGENNSGLPSEAVLQRLDQFCSEVYRTDVNGTLVFTWGEDGFKVNAEKGIYK